MPELSESARKHPSDPRRWTRRHHYQEGPGFLFVATQGGRPAADSLKSSQLARVRRRMRAVRRALRDGVEAAHRALGCPRRSLHRWLATFEAEGIIGLLDGSQRPRRLRPSIPPWVDQVIITIRLLTYWNSKRIVAESIAWAMTRSTVC